MPMPAILPFTKWCSLPMLFLTTVPSYLPPSACWRREEGGRRAKYFLHTYTPFILPSYYYYYHSDFTTTFYHYLSLLFTCGRKVFTTFNIPTTLLPTFLPYRIPSPGGICSLWEGRRTPTFSDDQWSAMTRPCLGVVPFCSL